MAGIKIADLYAQIGVKVDSSKLQNFLVKLSAVKMRVNQLSSALNKANSAMSSAFTAQVGAERLKAAQQRTIAAQFNAQAAASRAAAAAARASRIPPPRTQPARRPAMGGRVGMGSGGLSMTGMLGAPAGIIASLGGVYALTDSFVSVNKQMDSFKAGMKLSSGSAAEAAGQIEWLKNKASEFGTEFRGATQDFTQFSATTSAMGATTSQTRVMYSDIMKIQTALAMTPDQAEGMTRALTQMVSKGKVMSEELKGQLAERVPGAVAIMAKAMGKTVPELFAMMKDGALDAAEAVPKFLEEYAKLTDSTGAFKEQQNSLAATINRLKNAWFFFMEALGDSGLKDILKSALSWLADQIENLTLNIDNLKEMFIAMYDNAVKLYNGFMLVAPAVGVFAGALLFAASAAWILNGGLVVLFWRIVAFFAQMVIGSVSAAAGMWAMVLPILLFAAVLAAAYLIWQDLSSGDSWLLNWSKDANILQQAVTGVYDIFTWLFELVGGFTLPDWFNDFISGVDKMNGGGGGRAQGLGLMPSQKAAATSNTNNSGGNVTIGSITVPSADKIAPAVDGFRGNGMQSSYGNAPA